MYFQATSNVNNSASSDMETQAALEDFIASGRTGRRNAMPDILNSNHAGVGTGGLAEDMEKLNCAGKYIHTIIERLPPL